jgi:hypothetical protein
MDDSWVKWDKIPTRKCGVWGTRYSEREQKPGALTS